MPLSKADIIAGLKRDILSLEGIGSGHGSHVLDLGLGMMNHAFPDSCFPLGSVHEFISETEEAAAATTGFITGILSGLMKVSGVTVWIGSSGSLFPPALKAFGIEPDRVIFVDLLKERDSLWAIEESLKCKGLSAVVGEIPELSFTVSRRFQLAVEQSRVTGFILRNHPRTLLPNACVSRWKIEPIPTFTYDDLPGIGFPRWNVELLKIRNGRPGLWQLEWVDELFHDISVSVPSILSEPKRKTG
jgi:protein ImuA